MFGKRGSTTKAEKSTMRAGKNFIEWWEILCAEKKVKYEKHMSQAR